MLGRRPQPKLIMNFQPEPHTIRAQALTFSFVITVGNNGLGLANKLYLALNYEITIHGTSDENFIMTGNLGSENSAP